MLKGLRGFYFAVWQPLWSDLTATGEDTVQGADQDTGLAADKHQEVGVAHQAGLTPGRADQDTAGAYS